jgi:hypothetical protein
MTLRVENGNTGQNWCKIPPGTIVDGKAVTRRAAATLTSGWRVKLAGIDGYTFRFPSSPYSKVNAWQQVGDLCGPHL